MNTGMSRLEDLPQHILVRILCGVDHEDLVSLILVSKTIKEAALAAKQSHFEFATPMASIFGFTNPTEAENLCLAPLIKHERVRRSGRDLDHITVALFASPDEETWLRKRKYLTYQKV